MGPRGSCIRLITIAIMSVLVVAVAQPETPPVAEAEAYVVVTEAEQVIGTWASLGEWTRFDEDGTFRSAWRLERLEDAPDAVLTYRFEDGVMAITDLAVVHQPGCGDVVGRYELRLREDGSLQIVAIEDLCHPRRVGMARTYQPVE